MSVSAYSVVSTFHEVGEKIVYLVKVTYPFMNDKSVLDSVNYLFGEWYNDVSEVIMALSSEDERFDVAGEDIILEFYQRVNFKKVEEGVFWGSKALLPEDFFDFLLGSINLEDFINNNIIGSDLTPNIKEYVLDSKKYC